MVPAGPKWLDKAGAVFRQGIKDNELLSTVSVATAIHDRCRAHALENLGAILGSPMDPQVTPGSPLAPRRLLLQSSPSAADELKRRLAAAGIWFDVS